MNYDSYYISRHCWVLRSCSILNLHWRNTWNIKEIWFVIFTFLQADLLRPKMICWQVRWMNAGKDWWMEWDDWNQKVKWSKKAGRGNESLSSSACPCSDIRRWMRVNQGSIMRHYQVIESHWLTETMAFSTLPSLSLSLSHICLTFLFSFPILLAIIQQTTARGNEMEVQPSLISGPEIFKSILEMYVYIYIN